MNKFLLERIKVLINNNKTKINCFIFSWMLVCTLAYLIPIELACLLTLFIGGFRETDEFDFNNILADCAGMICGFIYIMLLS